jgi:RNA polymerase sigma factor (sigma-70 family)
MPPYVGRTSSLKRRNGGFFRQNAMGKTGGDCLEPPNIAMPAGVYTGMTGEAVALQTKAANAAAETAEGRIARLFDAHHQRLYRLARRMVSTTDDARDLVQETFLRAARSPKSVPDGAQPEEAWLVRVLVNVCRDRWRKRATRARLGGESTLSVLPPSDPERALIARHTVWAALNQLPPRRRAAIVMYELDRLQIAEIASMLGVSAVTVRWHLSRGRRELEQLVRRASPLGPPGRSVRP